MVFLYAAIAVEGIVYYIKAGICGELPKSCIASIALGIFTAVNFGLDSFGYLALHSRTPFAGNVLTGILLSRGSNYIFDFIGISSELPNIKTNIKKAKVVK